LNLSTSITADRIVVTADGELDVANVPQLRQYLHDALDEHPLPLVLDLTQVDFIDSATLGVLVGVHKRVGQEGRTLTLVSPRERLMRIFRLTALDRLFTIEPALPL
jgi:anti-sigma B factor antagonist